jgi:hypothetical protein
MIETVGTLKSTKFSTRKEKDGDEVYETNIATLTTEIVLDNLNGDELRFLAIRQGQSVSIELGLTCESIKPEKPAQATFTAEFKAASEDVAKEVEARKAKGALQVFEHEEERFSDTVSVGDMIGARSDGHQYEVVEVNLAAGTVALKDTDPDAIDTTETLTLEEVDDQFYPAENPTNPEDPEWAAGETGLVDKDPDYVWLGTKGDESRFVDHVRQAGSLIIISDRETGAEFSAEKSELKRYGGHGFTLAEEEEQAAEEDAQVVPEDDDHAQEACPEEEPPADDADFVPPDQEADPEPESEADVAEAAKVFVKYEDAVANRYFVEYVDGTDSHEGGYAILKKDFGSSKPGVPINATRYTEAEFAQHELDGMAGVKGLTVVDPRAVPKPVEALLGEATAPEAAEYVSLAVVGNYVKHKQGQTVYKVISHENGVVEIANTTTGSVSKQSPSNLNKSYMQVEAPAEAAAA